MIFIAELEDVPYGSRSRSRREDDELLRFWLFFLVWELAGESVSGSRRVVSPSVFGVDTVSQVWGLPS